jgi:nucleotide-binding universal stress UspA family protein
MEITAVFTSIMVALDGSHQANDALAAAAKLAGLAGGKLCLVTVPQQVFIPAIDGTMSYPMPFNKEDLDQSAKLTLDAAMDLVPDAIKSRTTARILYGDPAHAIVRYAADSGTDLIVLGRRGLGTISGLLLGSTTAKVSQLAPCAVLTVK